MLAVVGATLSDSPSKLATSPQVCVVHRTDDSPSSSRRLDKDETTEAAQLVVPRGRQAADDQLVEIWYA